MLKYTIKLILITMLMLSSCVAIASETNNDKEKFYLKAQVGRSNMLPIASFNNAKQHMRINVYGSFGAGYNIDDSLRAELQFEHDETKFAQNDKFTNLNVTYLNLNNVTINNISINMYKDVYTFDHGIKVFVGGGIGRSQINEKINYSIFRFVAHIWSPMLSQTGEIIFVFKHS